MELFKFIGAAIGTITGIFTIVDWLFRGKPHAYILNSNDNRDRVLVIQNISQYSVFIIGMTASNSEICFTENYETENFIKAQLSNSINKIIGPGDVYKLIIFSKSKDGSPTALKFEKFTIKITWRRGDNTFFWRFPLIVKGYSTDIIAP